MEVRELLKAYAEVLKFSQTSPKLICLSSKRNHIFKVIKVPFLSVVLTYLLIFHINRVIESLKRICYSKIFISEEKPYEESLKVIESFQKSLPRIPYKLIIFIYLVTIFIIAEFIFVDPKDIKFVTDILVASLTLNAKDFVNIVISVEDTSIFWRVVGFLSMIWGYIGLPIYTSFIAKRIIFNIYPNINLIKTSYMSDYFFESGGIYSLEKQLFKELGSKITKEIPFELISFGFIYFGLFMSGIITSYLAFITKFNLLYFVSLFNIVIASYMFYYFYSIHKKRNAEQLSNEPFGAGRI